MLTPPNKLSGRGLEEWDRVAPALDAAGRLSDANRTSLEMYCRAVFVWDYAATLGEEATDPEKRKYWLKVADAYAARVQSWAKEFGLTPRAEKLLGGFDDDDSDVIEVP